ncbi:hypothetical protein NX059_011908 [Plenodomus lindquistii]|nr:hypothetical protein NX059_011908 [Plenodomus lindquistii]
MQLPLRILSALTAIVALGAASDGVVFRRQSSNDSDYQVGYTPLKTEWTDKVGTNPWPEYPRPRLQRADWKNLNGVWRYREGLNADELPPFGERLERPVLVPFCLESALSGITGKNKIWSWYQTSFDVPSSWSSSNKVLLNFGAVDYNSTIYVNGKVAGSHTGGYFEFSIDVTPYLNSNGTNELIVHVFDPTDMGSYQIPIGKQTLDRGGMIWYTPCSGIWQTVWLESVPVEYITKLDLTADMDGTVNVTVHSNTNSSTSYELKVHELDSDDIKATATSVSGTPFTFTVDNPELWHPDSPSLYNITIIFGSDTVQSYTGFRTVSRGFVGGAERPLLNGKFVFPFGTLDQGYWPDGIYTPPSVEAMIYDLKVLKNVGYNMVRKHIKVEPALFYRACDEMGLLVIQDMPSLRPDVPVPNDRCSTQRLYPEAQAEFNRQLALMVEQLKSYTSIFAWTIYNEEWGQATSPPWPEFPLTDMVRSLDPTRLINAVSGWTDHGAGDFDDNHHYSTPQCGTPFWSNQGSGYDSAYDSLRIGIQGEFGGLGTQFPDDAHTWYPGDLSKQTAYELANTTELWNYRSHDLLTQLREQIDRFACSGGVWTQTTDVEGEVNGMMSYDRKVIRMDTVMWREDIQALYDAAARRADNATVVVENVGMARSQQDPI